MTTPRKLLPTPKTNLICDFDGTLTTSSTLNILALIGYSRNPPNTKPWSEITSAYAQDLQNHQQQYQQQHHHHHHHNNNIHKELEYQNNLRPVERASIERIEKAGIFKNVTPPDLINGATKAVKEDGSIRFRRGWDGLVRMIARTGGRVEIVSVNWSRVFIRAAIDAAFPGVADAVADTTTAGIRIRIAANDIQEDGSGRLTRPFSGVDGGIWTSADKVRLVQGVLIRSEQQQQSGHDVHYNHTRTIYVGDSPTDLGSLLEPGIIGITIRDTNTNSNNNNNNDDLTPLKSDQRELKEILDKSGNDILVKHIGEWNAEEWEQGQPAISEEESAEKEEKKKKKKKLLYWARDFGEISCSPLFA